MVELSGLREFASGWINWCWLYTFISLDFSVFKDEKTKSPFCEDFRAMGDTLGVSDRLCKPDHIYMDCMGFGMGCSCLQMTFQVRPVRVCTKNSVQVVRPGYWFQNQVAQVKLGYPKFNIY